MLAASSDAPLRILLQFVRANSAADPYAFSFEPQDYILPTAGGESPSARLAWSQSLLADLAALRMPDRDPVVVQRVGELLRNFILPTGWSHHEAAIAEAVAARRPIFLTIRSAAAEIYGLPWELLTLKSGQFLGELDGLLLRFEWPESPAAAESPHPRQEGGRVLIAWSAAGGAVPAAEHCTAIKQACSRGFHPFFREDDVLPHASLPTLIKKLEDAEQTGQPISILHLLCHGGSAGSTYGLVLDGDCGPVVLDAMMLRQQLARFAKMVRLVVLSACDSANQGSWGNQLGSVAQTLHRAGFAAVIASRVPLSVVGSITLCQALYSELLGVPASLEQAFIAARKQLLKSAAGPGQFDWASLQLYARHDAGDDTRPIVVRPYRGLLAFQPEHQRFYLGRETEVKEVLEDLQQLIEMKQPRLLIVAGASGSGKSSLVLAGAVPRLLAQNSQLVFLRMRPGSNPESALSEALAQRPAASSALLIIDQFEELFTHTNNPAKRSAFMKQVWALATAAEPDIRIILTLRIDFIGRCGELVVDDSGQRLDRIAYDEAHRVFVAQLQTEQMRTAIVEPARKVGLQLEPGLADRMLTEVDREPGALPLLQDSLDVLWQRRSDRTLTQAEYHRLGGVVGALQRRADAVVDRLRAADRAIAQRLLVSLVAVSDDTAQDTRRRVPLSELAQSFVRELPAFERVLRDLVDARLLVQDGDGKTAFIEVAHEALIRRWPRLRGFLDEDRAGLTLHRRVKQAAQQWHEQQRDASLLYRGGQLAQVNEWRSKWEARLSPIERDFLSASEALRQQILREAEERLHAERRRVQQSRAAALLLGFLLLLSGAAGWQAYRKSVAAKAEGELARDGQLVALALSKQEDPTTAATILREAGHRTAGLFLQAAVATLQAPIARQVLRPATPCAAMAISPDGRKVACREGLSAARITSPDTQLAPIVTPAHRGFVGVAQFSPDGRWLATGGEDGIVQLSASDGSAGITLKGHADQIDALAFSPTGKQLASGARDISIRLWNVDGTGTPRVLRCECDQIRQLAFSSDGKLLASGHKDGRIRIFDLGSNAPPRVLQSGDSEIYALTFSPDNTVLAAAGQDTHVRLWTLDDPTEPVVLSGHTDSVLTATFIDGGARLLTGSDDKTMQEWLIDDAAPRRLFRGHDAGVIALSASPDGHQLRSLAADGTLRRWDLGEAGEPGVVARHDDPVYAAAFGPADDWVLSVAKDGSIRRSRIDGSGSRLELATQPGFVYSAAVSSDGSKVVLGGQKLAQVIDLARAGKSWPLREHPATVWAVAISPDGTKVALGGDDGLVQIQPIDGTSAPGIILRGHQAPISAVAFSADGQKVISGSQDRTIRVFHADGAGASIVLSGFPASILAVAPSPDGRWIASGAEETVVRIHAADGSGQLRELAGHEDSVQSVAWSPDGTQIASGSWDKTVRLWNADGSGVPLVLRGHQSYVLSVGFSHRGDRLVTTGKDQTVRVFAIGGDSLAQSLWQATTDCLPEEKRRELLLESASQAQAGHARCTEQIAQRPTALR